ncbi:glycosyltransferase [uncultured Duncaniella sp.]|uniref:glycosyltransferase n=1 Tax=uncultured Duncaniella sp. TaxID=2768039 RepID=UPI002731D1D6|nr:glycosyltransferase [uncultured Duncaniella sp.]
MEKLTAIIIVQYLNNSINFEQLKDNPKYKIIVVDNSPKRDLALSCSNIIYVPLKVNKGIAAAQNIGILKAKELGCFKILFFDQDSLINRTLVDMLSQAYDNIALKGELIGAVGPLVLNKVTKKKYKVKASCHNEYSEVSTLISSGTCTTINVLDNVGLFEEDLFIDLVDHEWCWRASQKGFKLYSCNIIHMSHRVGEGDYSFLGFPIIKSSPFRYYFIFRNTLRLLKRNYVPFDWKLKRTIRCVGTVIYIGLSTNFKGVKREIMKNVLRGLKDGILSPKQIKFK